MELKPAAGLQVYQTPVPLPSNSTHSPMQMEAFSPASTKGSFLTKILSYSSSIQPPSFTVNLINRLPSLSHLTTISFPAGSVAVAGELEISTPPSNSQIKFAIGVAVPVNNKRTSISRQ